MIALTVESVRKHFGPDPVLDGVTFDVRLGQRIGLVGPNGTGKSTLMNILCGLVEPDAGSVRWTSSVRWDYVRQQTQFDPGQTVWQEAEQALADQIAWSQEANQLAKAIASTTDEARRAELAEQFDRLQAQLTQHDAYHVDHRIERVLQGLGFSAETYRQPVVQLSGGQQNRLLLGKLLLSAPDVVLLDEPSNHLDVEATQWLEDYLVQSKQTLLIVSHDRYFLDRVTDWTYELFQGTIDRYRGNFSAYRKQKAERLEVQRRTYENQQAEIARLEDFVRKHHHGQKHAQAEDRRKKLERIEPVPPPREIELPPMAFPPASRTGDIVMRVEALSKHYDQPLLSDLTFDVLRGERWGIMGGNGTGKSTLLKCLLGIEPIDSGNISHGTGVVIGYFDQLLGSLDSETEAVENVRPEGKEFNEQQRRDMLARFGIRGDMVFQRMNQLSGGERNRVALARLAASEANLLVLDEPTNHLDLWARDALEQALKQWDGTLICVSHDRYFLNQVVDHLIILATGSRHRIVLGNFDQYRALDQAQATTHADSSQPSAVKSSPNNQSPTPSATKDGNRGKPRRKRKFPYRKVDDLEQEITTVEEQLESLHGQLTDADVLRDGRRVKEVQAKIDATQRQLDLLLEHWEEACELN